MKYYGSYFEYTDARNEDLMRAFFHQLESNKGKPLTTEFYQSVVDMPSRRFWVSEERAAIVVTTIIKGSKLETMRPSKREMYFEIYNRVLELRKQDPDASVFNLTFEVVNGPAPKFYLEPSSAKVIIGKINRKWYEKRKQRQRHS